MTQTGIAIDKTSWGDGPWQSEPDRKEWRDHKTGLPCLAVRHPQMGNWCGYVAVPPKHPAHGKDYDSLDAEVHGGLTYAGECSGDICHVPAPGEPDNVYWFGFDCAHAWDVTPGTPSYKPADATYYELDYVERQCARLAQQLAAMTP